MQVTNELEGKTYELIHEADTLIGRLQLRASHGDCFNV